MKKKHKVTQAEFKRFKESFLYWQEKLSCLDYEVFFEMSKEADDNDCYARLIRSGDGKNATAQLGTEIQQSDLVGFSPEGHGLHEAIHLFLGRLDDLARDRYCSVDEIKRTEEGMVRILEKLLRR